MQVRSEVESIDVPRRNVVTVPGSNPVVRFPDLADAVESEWKAWKAKGQHAAPTDRRVDQAVLHTDNQTEFEDIVGVLDAIYRTHRNMQLGSKVETVPAFRVTFAAN